MNNFFFFKKFEQLKTDSFLNKLPFQKSHLYLYSLYSFINVVLALLGVGIPITLFSLLLPVPMAICFYKNCNTVAMAKISYFLHMIAAAVFGVIGCGFVMTYPYYRISLHYLGYTLVFIILTGLMGTIAYESFCFVKSVEKEKENREIILKNPIPTIRKFLFVRQVEKIQTQCMPKIGENKDLVILFNLLTFIAGNVILAVFEYRTYKTGVIPMIMMSIISFFNLVSVIIENKRLTYASYLTYNFSTIFHSIIIVFMALNRQYYFTETQICYTFLGLPQIAFLLFTFLYFNEFLENEEAKITPVEDINKIDNIDINTTEGDIEYRTPETRINMDANLPNYEEVSKQQVLLGRK
jgi:hypothetical protein